MRPSTLLIRGLRFHWRSHLAVALGVAATTATLTGALLVGDSMRVSLRDSALGRLGSIQDALVSNRFFRQSLTNHFEKSPSFPDRFSAASPVLLLHGGATNVDTRAHVNGMNILGVDESFWALEQANRAPAVVMPTERAVILNEPLADELGAKPGATVLIHVGRPSAVSIETLLGRRADTATTLRLTVAAVVPARGLGAFTLRPSQLPPLNAWIPRNVLQRAVDRRDRVNAILVGGSAAPGREPDDNTKWIQMRLRESLDLSDLGLRLRVDPVRKYISLESESLLINPAIENAALSAAKDIGANAIPMLTYLANRIEVVRRGDGTAPHAQAKNPKATVIPYSTVTALPIGDAWLASLVGTGMGPGFSLGPGEILLNRWAGDDLNAHLGDRIQVTYLMTKAFGRLESVQHSFVLRGVVEMSQAAADPGFTPEYKGITDTQNLADWDPPFPIDLNLIRDKDEAYWDQYHATPKAFLSLEDGRTLWADQHARFGTSTAIRLVPPAGTSPATLADRFGNALLDHLDPAEAGLAFEPVRRRAAIASNGTTDFGGLFIGFSFFLIAAAALLAALFFRLGVERRTREAGIELATGIDSKRVRGFFLSEGCLIAAVGGGLGCLLAWAYAWLMLAGLRTWWSAAANTPFLQLHVQATTLAIGFAAGVVLAIASIAWSIRGFTRLPVSQLLAGVVTAQTPRPQRVRRRRSTVIAVASLIGAVAMLLFPTASGSASQAGAFFGGGAALLVAALALFNITLQAPRQGIVRGSARLALVRFGIRNASRHPGRSLLTAGLIASATFVVTALAAFRIEVQPDTAKSSGTGGFSLLAESAIQLPFDLNTPEGREALGMSKQASAAMAHVDAVPFRLRLGDETGCLNLYTPTQPRILGATQAMIDRGGFTFQSTLAQTASEQDNPWTLLNKDLPDGVIPVIGDEAAVLWQLHLGLGKELQVTDDRGNHVRLRFVALLAGSVLQDEVIIAESHFVDLFPSIEGHGFFLLEAPSGSLTEIRNTLESELAKYSFDVTTTAKRLADYLAVQNTYLSTFQTLGGLGLVLGTVGLAAVLLRNVWERRGELALMRALGFSRSALATTVLVENVALVAIGLLAGFVPAMLAVAPHLATRPTALPWATMAATLVGVLLVGIGGGMVALIPTLRAPLLPALRRE